MARKEMHLFGSDLNFGSQFYRRDQAAYLAEFEGWQEQRHAGEASVWYLLSSRAAEEIKSFNPDARIIIMLRNPVEMLHSMYYSFRWDGNEHLPTFEEALLAQSDRRAGRGIGRQTYFLQGLFYSEIARYAEQVGRYFNVFGRERVHVIIYNDFAADAGKTFRQTLEFLGADTSNLQAAFKAVNENKFIKNRAVSALLSDRMLRSTILAIRPLLPRAIFNAMQKMDARIRNFNSRVGGRAPLSLELRQELQHAFTPEVERLSVVLGRDLTNWTRDAGLRANETPKAVHSPAKTPSESSRADADQAANPGGENMALKSTAWI